MNVLRAQEDSSVLPQKDSSEQKHEEKIVEKHMNTKSVDLGTLQDTVKVKDTIVKDSLSALVNAVAIVGDSSKGEPDDHLKNYDSVIATFGLPVFAKPKFMLTPEKIPDEKNELFYVIAGIIFLLALVKNIFPNYLRSTFGLFLQTTGINTETKYTTQQNGAAFVLMQLVFVFCGGIYMALVFAKYFHLFYSFGEIFLFSVVFLVVIYILKDAVINFFGWVFNLKAEAKIYLLYVFLVNRVLAIVFIPIILVLAFSPANITYYALFISFILFMFFLIYRYFLTIKTIRSKLQAKTIQIFLYLCIVEFLPIVLLYKLIVNYTNGMN